MTKRHYIFNYTILLGYRPCTPNNANDLYLVHIRALIAIYQINTDKYTHIFLSPNFINTMRHSNMFQLLRVHLQVVYCVHSKQRYFLKMIL